MSPTRPRLASSRCYNHPEREASARCTACGRSYCRECVAEHGGRMLCGTCLRRDRPERTGGSHAWARRALGAVRLIGAGLVAWSVFYFAGRLMLGIPSEFHEGTVWKGDWWQATDE